MHPTEVIIKHELFLTMVIVCGLCDIS